MIGGDYPLSSTIIHRHKQSDHNVTLAVDPFAQLSNPGSRDAPLRPAGTKQATCVALLKNQWHTAYKYGIYTYIYVYIYII